MLEGYRARVDERTFLNLPGFRNGNAFVYIYVEDTSAREPMVGEYCTDECPTCPTNFEPRMILQVCDGEDVASFGFDVDTPRGRENSLYKLDTMIAALRVFRTGFVAEFAPYDRRERQIEELKDTTRAAHRRPGLRGRGSDGRAPRLQRGGAGSNPAVSMTGPLRTWPYSLRMVRGIRRATLVVVAAAVACASSLSATAQRSPTRRTNAMAWAPGEQLLLDA